MKDFLKNKVVTTVIVVATVILAGVAIFTALRLYQLRQQAVAPTAPESQPEATGPTTIACQLLTFNITVETPTPTPTGTLTPTPTPTTVTSTSTPSPTPSTPIGGGETPTPTQPSEEEPTSTPTTPAGATNTPTTSLIAEADSPTPGGDNLPAAGISLPTIAGLAAGFLIILVAIVFAF